MTTIWTCASLLLVICDLFIIELGVVFFISRRFGQRIARTAAATFVALTLGGAITFFVGSVAYAMKPVIHAYDGSRADLEDVIAATWPVEQVDAAIGVAWCESRGKATASNGQYKGLFQMGRREWAKYGLGKSPYDPHANSAAAYRYWSDVERTNPGKGWLRWECRPS